MRKTGTLIRLNRSSTSIESPPPPPIISELILEYPQTKASRKQRSISSLIEFPSSPQIDQQQGEGRIFIHTSHSQHPLAQVKLAEPFTCGGCKEYGAGNRFACQNCNFQLHDFCASSPPALEVHPLHCQHHLLFSPKPKTGVLLWPRCDICGKPTKGFMFKCSACDFQMHPCCAMLSNEMNFPLLHPHTLKLLPPSFSSSLSGGPNNGEHAAAACVPMCGECKRKRGGRVYRCTSAACDYHLHAACAKSMMNGLQANGIKTSSEKPSSRTSLLGSAARLASQVIIQFLGGIMEGLGEGVGQVIIQNMSRGRRRSSSSRSTN